MVSLFNKTTYLYAQYHNIFYYNEPSVAEHRLSKSLKKATKVVSVKAGTRGTPAYSLYAVRKNIMGAVEYTLICDGSGYKYGVNLSS